MNRIALWDAIHEYVHSCGGLTDRASDGRMNAVAAVERALGEQPSLKFCENCGAPCHACTELAGVQSALATAQKELERARQDAREMVIERVAAEANYAGAIRFLQEIQAAADKNQDFGIYNMITARLDGFQARLVAESKCPHCERAESQLAEVTRERDEAKREVERWQKNWCSENENLERVSAADREVIASERAAREAAEAQCAAMRAILSEADSCGMDASAIYPIIERALASTAGASLLAQLADARAQVRALNGLLRRYPPDFVGLSDRLHNEKAKCASANHDMDVADIMAVVRDWLRDQPAPPASPTEDESEKTK